MAILAADAEAEEPPEYMSIVTPPSSPELGHSDLSRTKTSDWIKQLHVESMESNQCDQSHLSETMKTPLDSAKKSRGKRFVPGGLAEQLQRVIQRENSEITFWEHRSKRLQEEKDAGIILHVCTCTCACVL